MLVDLKWGGRALKGVWGEGSVKRAGIHTSLVISQRDVAESENNAETWRT